MKLKKSLSMLAIILSLSAFGTFSMPDDADARRFGSSRSIGRTTTVRPSAPAGVTSSQQNFQQQRGINNNAGAAAMNRGGMFGGLLGGLLAGSLLGSLLMGGGFAGGGLLDIVIIGLLVYFGLKFFRNRRQNSDQSSAYNNREYRQNDQYQNYSGAGSAWDNLRSERVQPEVQHDNSDIPASFDTEEFLAGAKKLYVRMQESWDLRDMEDIKQFTSPLLYKEIEEQYKEDPNPSKTQLLLVNARVLGVQEEGDFEQVAVLFDVLMKEQENENNEQVKEIWNFSRDKVRSGSWFLDGIQQM